MTVPTSLVLAVVAAVALQRLAELWLARRWLRASAVETGAVPEREPAFVAMVALHTAWLAGCLAEPLAWPRPVPPALLAAAGLLWLAALGLRAWTLRALGRYWHVRVVRRARQPVVTGGPYRFIRHPNYLAVIVELAAVPLLLGAYGTALLAGVLNAALLAVRIRREEAYLLALPAYRQAFAGKARFLPGVF
jgi:methyltransferase